MYRTIKSYTRQYRKALRKMGIPFPLVGAFHVTDANGQAIRPDQLYRFPANDCYVEPGPATHDPAPAPVAAVVPISPPKDAPAVPQVFKRTVTRGIKNGKECVLRTAYRPVKNPKGGESYWVKREVNGKNKYVEVNYSKLLADLETEQAA